jgi:hypothetical protein
MSLDSSLRAVVVALTESQWQVQPFQAHTQCSQHDSSGDNMSDHVVGKSLSLDLEGGVKWQWQIDLLQPIQSPKHGPKAHPVCF